MAKKLVIERLRFHILSAVCDHEKAGSDIVLFEKNHTPGGRARIISSAGFTFDMGPILVQPAGCVRTVFQQFSKTISDYYDFKTSDPSLRVCLPEDDLYFSSFLN